MITKMMNGMGGTIQKKTNLKIWNEPHYITHAYNHHSSMFFCWMIQWWKWENFSIFFKFMRLNRQTTNNTKTTTINKNQCFETMSEHLFWLFIWKCQHHYHLVSMSIIMIIIPTWEVMLCAIHHSLVFWL